MPDAAADVDLSDFEDVVPGSDLCPVGRILASLDEERATKLAAALTRPGGDREGRYRVPADRIRHTLKGWGHTLSANSIGKHRRGVCGCPTMTS